MKTRLTIITAGGFIGGMAVVTFNQALAIEPPPDTAQPPAALLNGIKNPTPKEFRKNLKENIPFIGLATATIPDMVADHLNVERSSAVIIRTVWPNSPAEKAGLSENDVIISVGETAVGTPETLSSLIREHKPGDRLSFSLIHKGKPAKVEVSIAERPANLVTGIDQKPMLEGLPQAHADRLRGLIDRNLGAFDINGLNDTDIFPGARIEDSLRMMREQMNRALDGDISQIRPDSGGGIHLQNNSTIRMMDNQGSIEIRSSSGDTQVTVRDEKNDIVWSGPWNSDEDKNSTPKGIRERIEKVNSANGAGFSFRFGKPMGLHPETLEN